jgi:hypothetical protein
MPLLTCRFRYFFHDTLIARALPPLRLMAARRHYLLVFRQLIFTPPDDADIFDGYYCRCFHAACFRFPFFLMLSPFAPPISPPPARRLPPCRRFFIIFAAAADFRRGARGAALR